MSFIILDRDGVINHESSDYIKSPEEWIPIPGSLQAIAKLNRAGFKIIIATNQSGIARGFYDLTALTHIHTKLLSAVNATGGYIEDIFFCPHHPDEQCLCRKPKPGLLHDIQKKYAINFADTFLIGDKYSDMQVAKEVGCKPILVLTGKGQTSLAKHPELKNIHRFADLSAAAEYIVQL